MNRLLQVFQVSFLLLGAAKGAYAQVLYGYANIFASNEIYMVKIDLATCTVCPVKTDLNQVNIVNPFTVLPNGTQLHYNGQPGLTVEEIPPSSAIVWEELGIQSYEDGVLAPNGLVYITSYGSGLYSFDPLTYVITFLGQWPPGGSCDNIFYVNGELHGYWTANSGVGYDMVVNTSNPAASVLGIANPPFKNFARELTWNGINGIVFLDPIGSGTIKFFNPVTGTTSTICAFAPPIKIFNICTAPSSVPEYACTDVCITTNAGMYNNIGPYTGCSTVYLPEVPNALVNPTEVVNYILYTNPNNPLGSTISTSTGSYFFYNPATMQTGVNYYAAAIAGNNAGGMVNLADPCLDISDSIIVQFKVKPTVSFMAVPAEICPGGCQTITATFTGDPPFALTGQMLSGANVLLSFFENFAGNTGTFEVCAPASVPPGPILIRATSVTDDNCICN